MAISDFVPKWSAEQNAELSRNGVHGFEGDHVPVVRLYDPTSRAYWLLTARSPRNPALFWGLADLGVAGPEEGLIDYRQLATLHAGLGVTLDTAFDPKDKRLSQFLEEGRKAFRAGR